MINSFKEAIDFIKSTIPVTTVKKFPGAKGLERQEKLLELIGNPQDKIKVIHIAGTTGKTSTVKIINDLLIGQGFKVGLTVSPHLIDIRERIQINNELISQEDFVENLNAIMPAIKEVAKSKLEMLTYFEVMVALFYYSFEKAKVDYAVIETGMGGTNDGTNTIHSENKIAVITPIGLDHTKILGKTISEIAQKKAGIINKLNPVFSALQNINAVKVLNERAKLKSIKINYLVKNINYKNIIIKSDGIEFDYFGEKLKIKNLYINTLGNYQIENCALGIKVLEFVSTRENWEIDESKLRENFKTLNIEGRMSIKYLEDTNGKKKMLILDGAHNPQKMSALIKSIKSLNLKQKIAFVIAFKNDKNFKKMLEYIMPIADKIILTSFYVDDMDFIQISTEPEDVAKNLEIKGYKNFEIIKNSSEALKSALNSHEVVVVTGSLYLLHKLYTSIIK